MTTELMLALLLGPGTCAPPGPAPIAATPVPIPAAAPGLVAPPASAPDGPSEYYAFELVPTRRVPGTGAATGTAAVTFAPSPFGITLAPDGSYALDVHLDVRGLPRRPDASVYAVWITTPSLDRVVRAGALDAEGRLTARSTWNKFLVVITLEPTDDSSAGTWSGPVVLRGMSRSGMMHTMAGHGPFEQENCAAYGYE